MLSTIHTSYPPLYTLIYTKRYINSTLSTFDTFYPLFIPNIDKTTKSASVSLSADPLHERTGMNQYTEQFFAQFADQWVVAHQDARRTIEEVDTPEFCVQRYTVHMQIGLGNHYHQLVAERFFFVSGNGTIYLIPIVKGIMHLEPTSSKGTYGVVGRSKVQVGPGSTLEVPLDTAHLFMMEPGAIFFCHSHGSFKTKWDATKTRTITPW